MVIPVLLASLVVLALLYLGMKIHEQSCAKRMLHIQTKKPIPITTTIAENLTKGMPNFKDIDQYARRAKYENFMSFIGPIPFYTIVNPEDFKTMVLNPKYIHKFFDFLPPAAHRLLGKSVFSTNGEEWRLMRKLMDPAFFNVDTFAEIFSIKSIQCIDLMSKHGLVHPTKVMTDLTIDILGKTIFDFDFQMLEQNITSNKYVEAYQFVLENMSKPIRVLGGKLYDSLPISDNKQFDEKMDKLNELMIEMIQISKSKNRQGETLLDKMVRSTDVETGKGLTDDQLRANLIILFVAGHETTATALSFAFYVLGKHTHVQEKLFEEVRRVVGDDPNTPITLEHIEQMEYLKWTIKEILRMYPPVSYFPARKLERAETIGNYRLQKGQLVNASMVSIHQNPKYWKNPKLFYPERFSPEESIGRHSHAYVPFGGGPRTCIGNKFSLLEQEIFIATLVQRYQVILDPNYEIGYKLVSIFCMPEDDLAVTLVPRETKL